MSSSLLSNWDLWNWAISQNIKLKAAHIAGQLNALAEHLSRVKIRQTEWILNKKIVETFFSNVGTPMIDMMLASVYNRQTQIFCTWYSLGRDVSLCTSLIMFDFQSSSTYQTIQLSGNSDSSNLAEKAFVHRAKFD